MITQTGTDMRLVGKVICGIPCAWHEGKFVPIAELIKMGVTL